MNSEKIIQIKELAIAFVTSLDIPYSSISVIEEDERIWVTLIPQENISRYIGYRGQNIAAMQHLFSLILWNNGFGQDEFIIFDIDGYKKQNEEKILIILERKIKKINETGEPQIMPFLESQDRRMVHLIVLKKYGEYQTESFTEEKNNRRVLRISRKIVQDSLL